MHPVQLMTKDTNYRTKVKGYKNASSPVNRVCGRIPRIPPESATVPINKFVPNYTRKQQKKEISDGYTLLLTDTGNVISSIHQLGYDSLFPWSKKNQLDSTQLKFANRYLKKFQLLHPEGKLIMSQL